MAVKKNITDGIEEKVIPAALPDEFIPAASDSIFTRVQVAPGFVLSRVNTNPMCVAEVESDPGRIRVEQGAGYVINEELCSVITEGNKKFLKLGDTYLYVESEKHYQLRSLHRHNQAIKQMQSVQSNNFRQGLRSNMDEGVTIDEANINYRETMPDMNAPQPGYVTQTFVAPDQPMLGASRDDISGPVV